MLHKSHKIFQTQHTQNCRFHQYSFRMTRKEIINNYGGRNKFCCFISFQEKEEVKSERESEFLRKDCQYTKNYYAYDESNSKIKVLILDSN